MNGVAGAVSFRDGRPFAVGAVTVRGGRIVELDFLVDPERLRQLDLTILDGLDRPPTGSGERASARISAWPASSTP